MRKSLKEKTNFDLFNHLLVEERVAAAAAAAANECNQNNIAAASIPTNKIREITIINLDTPTEDEKPPDDIQSQNCFGAAATSPALVEQMDIGNTTVDATLVNDKTTEWIRNTTFEHQMSEDTNTINTDNNNSIQMKDEHVTDDDKTLNELLDQVAELDEIYTDHQLLKSNAHIEQELNGLDHALPKFPDETAMDFDDLFDDTATYTSLQIAFKNPVPILDLVPPSPPANFDTHDAAHYDAVEPLLIVNPPAPIIDVSAPLKRESPKLDDEKLPPLPPKRCKKMALENNENQPALNNNIKLIENLSRNNSIKSLTTRPPSQIIIMKTPEQSPINKRLPPAPPFNHTDGGSGTADAQSNTVPKPMKKPGFFSKLFSRKKSKPDINLNTTSASKNQSTDNSREPSLQLAFDPTDPNRASTRSIKSLHIPATTSNNKKLSTGKPVGRSVSSVSGKRPQITADVIHIPLKGDSEGCLPMRSGSGTLLSIPDNEAYERASTATLTNNLDRKTVSALQLADLPLTEGNMELIAIADRQSLRNLCEGEFGVQLDPNIDLTEAEHYALYTSVAPHATESEFDETSCYYAPVETGQILTQSEVAKRLAASSFT